MTAAVVTFPAPKSLDRAEAIRRIRAALRERTGRAWSVSGGRGTSWGWVSITSPAARLVCGIDGRGCGPDCRHPRPYLSEDDRAMLALALGLGQPVHCQGESIPAAGDYRAEYVDRAEGRPPRQLGRPYWD